METPDGKQFGRETRATPVKAAASALGSAAMMLARAAGKIIITTWRLAAALDSALWRATKLIAGRIFVGLSYAARLAGAAFRALLLWLPTRTGRAYSAMMGVFLVVVGLWMVDLLRATPSLDGSGASALRPPLDEEDPILARIEGRYVHLSEIEAAARAGGVLRTDEALTPKTAFERKLVESYVEQRLLARAALDNGLQRSPGVARRVNAARDRVLASAYMDAQVQSAVTPEVVERLYEQQSDVTRLGDEVRARHIVVATGEEAQEIITLLEGGSNFGALARERSTDRATAPVGGEIGWFSRAMMTPVFSRAAFNTAPGEMAAPFQTEFGWHIVEVLERRATSDVPFDQVSASIEDFLRMRTFASALRELEEESQVVYFRQQQETPDDIDPPELTDRPVSDPAATVPESADGQGGSDDKSTL